MAHTEYSCTCDNHCTRWPAPVAKHGPRCRRHMWRIPDPIDWSNGRGVGASGRGDDDPELMERVARMYNVG